MKKIKSFYKNVRFIGNVLIVEEGKDINKLTGNVVKKLLSRYIPTLIVYKRLNEKYEVNPFIVRYLDYYGIKIKTCLAYDKDTGEYYENRDLVSDLVIEEIRIMEKACIKHQGYISHAVVHNIGDKMKLLYDLHTHGFNEIKHPELSFVADSLARVQLYRKVITELYDFVKARRVDNPEFVIDESLGIIHDGYYSFKNMVDGDGAKILRVIPKSDVVGFDRSLHDIDFSKL